MATKITVSKCERGIGIGAYEWPGRCHEIALMLVKFDVVKGAARYGVYWGPIAKRGRFAGRPFSRHGWIERPRGGIIDPTRWVFEDVNPYIFVCDKRDPKVEQYDLGGSRLHGLGTDPPEHTGESYNGNRVVFPKRLHAWLHMTFGRTELDRTQLFWLAAQPPCVLNKQAAAIYAAFADAGHLAWVPFDYRTFTFGPSAAPKGHDYNLQKGN
jgi:hypothetical protein